MDQQTSDTKNYRELSIPFASREEANKNIEKFYEAVKEARQEFEIPDVHVLCKINIIHNEREGSALSSAHFGNSLEAAPMCAWSLGQEQTNYQTAIAQYLKEGSL